MKKLWIFLLSLFLIGCNSMTSAKPNILYEWYLVIIPTQKKLSSDALLLDQYYPYLGKIEYLCNIKLYDDNTHEITCSNTYKHFEKIFNDAFTLMQQGDIVHTYSNKGRLPDLYAYNVEIWNYEIENLNKGNKHFLDVFKNYYILRTFDDYSVREIIPNIGKKIVKGEPVSNKEVWDAVQWRYGDSVKFKDVNDKYQPKTDIPIVKEYWDNQKKIIQESNKKYLEYLRLNPELNSEEKRLKMYEIKWETELKYLPEEYKLMCCTKLSE